MWDIEHICAIARIRGNKPSTSLKRFRSSMTNRIAIISQTFFAKPFLFYIYCDLFQTSEELSTNVFENNYQFSEGVRSVSPDCDKQYL